VSPFLREVAYSDESAAMSPSLIGATAAALGVPLVPASTGGLLGQLGSALGGPAQALGETLFLTIVRADADAVGISLQGVDLFPMRLHDNNADFMSIDFLAWTQSSRRVYVNVPGLIDIFTGAMGNGSTAVEALAQTRATAVFIVRHEVNHVTQFKANGDQPPANFAAMMTFEEQAYGGDETWLGTAPVQTFLLNNIGTQQAVVDDLVAAARNAKDQFQIWNTDASLNTNAKRRDAMKQEAFLPQAVRGKVDYKTADLYRTKAP
jgi:hypothetical protein